MRLGVRVGVALLALIVTREPVGATVFAVKVTGDLYNYQAGSEIDLGLATITFTIDDSTGTINRWIGPGISNYPGNFRSSETIGGANGSVNILFGDRSVSHDGSIDVSFTNQHDQLDGDRILLNIYLQHSAGIYNFNYSPAYASTDRFSLVGNGMIQTIKSYDIANYLISSELFSASTISQFQTLANSTSIVPEPASWMLVAGGFGLIGAAMRRSDGCYRSRSRGISSTKLQGVWRLSSWVARMPSHPSFTAPVEPGSANR